jgi:hypothetical protein
MNDPIDLIRTTFLGTPHLQRPRRARIAYFIVHDAEVFSAAWDDPTAELIARWFKNEASRGSAHGACDSDSSQRLLAHGRAAAGAPPLNDSGWHLELEGRASWTKEQWARPHVRRALRRGAWFASREARKHDIPIRWLTVPQLKRAGKTPQRPVGFCTHNDIRLAWGETVHWDPGPNFPKAYWLGLVAWYARWGRPLAVGVHGTTVVVWKRRLHQLGYRGFTVLYPGFGAGIVRATAKFQRDRKLEDTGVVDADTWAAAAA